MITLDFSHNYDNWFNQLNEKFFLSNAVGYLKDIGKEPEVNTAASRKRGASRLSKGTGSRGTSGKSSKS